MEEAKRWHVLDVADLPEGGMRGVEIEGRSVLICRVQGGAWHGLDDICTHAFAKLHEGRLRGNRIICPLHGASFDCRTGAVLAAPAARGLKVHELRVVDGKVELAFST